MILHFSGTYTIYIHVYMVDWPQSKNRFLPDPVLELPAPSPEVGYVYLCTGCTTCHMGS